VWWYTSVIPATEGKERGKRIWFEVSLGKVICHKTLSEKETKSRVTGGVAQGMQYLPSQLEAFSSITSPTAKKEKISQ
jgi:hypothetical protein